MSLASSDRKDILSNEMSSGRPPVSPQRTYSPRSMGNGDVEKLATRFNSKPKLLGNYQNSLNPNYRPLENSSMGKRKPLEASLFVTRSDAERGSSESCVSLSISRSPSPYSNRSTTSSRSASTKSNVPQIKKTTPYRLFPQSYSPDHTPDEIDRVMKQLEPSSIVLNANMSFFLGTTKQNVRQNIQPSPSHQEPETASNYLSSRISDFLMRTDHVMDEWKGMKKEKGPDKIRLVERDRENQQLKGRSRSVNNILVKGYQILQSNQLPPTSRSRPTSVSRDSSVLSDTDTLVDEQEEEVNAE